MLSGFAILSLACYVRDGIKNESTIRQNQGYARVH